MAIPTDYIFQSGTVLKNGIFDLIVNKLVSAGWVDISSKPATDYVVLTSTGNTGDKSLVLNLRDLNSAATPINSVKTTNFNTMSYRLQSSYTPGAAGVAGTFGRPTQAWNPLDIVPTVVTSGTLAADTVINYKVYADASKIILVLEYPITIGYNPMVIYMGQPDSEYVVESASRGVLVATTTNATLAANVQVCNSPDGVGATATSYSMPTTALIPLTNPNAIGKYFESDIYYQSSTEGIRGKLDGVLCLLNSSISTGDIVTVGAKTYYCVVCHVQGATSFPSQALLVRTA